MKWYLGAILAVAHRNGDLSGDELDAILNEWGVTTIRGFNDTLLWLAQRQED